VVRRRWWLLALLFCGWLLAGAAHAQSASSNAERGPRSRAPGKAARCSSGLAKRLSPKVLRVHVEEASVVYGVPAALIWAVMRVESNFAPLAVSCDRAMGLMQLLGSTAAEMGVTRPFDPRQNVLGGTRYLRMLADRWGGDLVLTIASYNAGPGAVARYGGVPPYAETRGYVKRVLMHLRAYWRQQRSGNGGLLGGELVGRDLVPARGPLASVALE